MKKAIRRFSLITAIVLILTTLSVAFCGCELPEDLDLGKLNDIIADIQDKTESKDTEKEEDPAPSFATLNDIPEFSGSPFVILNDNQPNFTVGDLVKTSYEKYSELDTLGRCGVAMACVGTDIMPTEDRESIGSVKPSGWQSVKYDIVDGKYLYNRCHLIGFQLTGENANKLNLITGTRYMNVDGMLPFENMIADYVKETDNHVIFRVTPVFDGNNLVASGVIMEAYSVEDNGEGICFNVYVYNAQPGITINYATGDSALGDVDFETGNDSESDVESELESEIESESESESEEISYVNPDGTVNYTLNTNTKKFHYPDCSSAKSISAANKSDFVGDRETLTSQGYKACGVCKP